MSHQSMEKDGNNCVPFNYIDQAENIATIINQFVIKWDLQKIEYDID